MINPFCIFIKKLKISVKSSLFSSRPKGWNEGFFNYPYRKWGKSEKPIQNAQRVTRTIFVLCAILLLSCSCKKEKDTTFLIAQDSIGKLNRKSLARDIEIIFAKDSIVKDTVALRFGNGAQKIKVYEKGGKHLLTLTPTTDSIPIIENIRIEDIRYKTEKGIGLLSTFKDIRDNYTVKKVFTSTNNVVIFVKESNAYFTIDKQELPSSLRYAASTNIEAVQIPDKAKIKYFMVGWN